MDPCKQNQILDSCEAKGEHNHDWTFWRLSTIPYSNGSEPDSEQEKKTFFFFRPVKTLTPLWMNLIEEDYKSQKFLIFLEI